MYNLNYRLYATPDSKIKGLYNLSIICKTSHIEDWNETPKEQRYTEVCFNDMKFGYEMAKKSGENIGLFHGYDCDMPKNSLLVMEENLKMTAHGRFAYPIFRRNGFQRHRFEGTWNVPVGFLRDYVGNLVKYSKKLEKKLTSKKASIKFTELEKEALEESGGKENFNYVKNLNKKIVEFIGK